MRVMVLVKASETSEFGGPPDPQMMADMGVYNKKLVDAGVMIDADGLLPTSKGYRVRFDGDERTVTQGPFPNVTDLLGGYWLWEVDSMEGAIAWLKQAPFDGGVEVELRKIATAEDFGEAMTDELRAQEDELRERLDKR